MKLRNKNFIYPIFLLVSLSAFNSSLELNPKKVLENYLDASLKGRSEEAYGYLSSDDKAVKSLKEYIAENKIKDGLGKSFKDNTSFKILNVVTNERKATGKVEMTVPNLFVLAAKIIVGAFKSSSSDNDEQYEKDLVKKYESGNFIATTMIQTYRLVKEQKSWKVFLDWRTQITEQEKADKEYTKILEKLDAFDINVEEKEDIKKTKSFREKESYLKKIKIYDIESGYYETYSEKKVAGVNFKIKNKGERTLKELEVTVYFKDSNGTIIFEEDFHPVFVSKYSFGRNDKPLKPNYIWQMEERKFFQAKSVPTEWLEGSISVRITNIEFLEESVNEPLSEEFTPNQNLENSSSSGNSVDYQNNTAEQEIPKIDIEIYSDIDDSEIATDPLDHQDIQNTDESDEDEIRKSKNNENRWRKDSFGTVIDTNTDLMWMTSDFRNIEKRSPHNWSEVMEWVEKINFKTFGGYSGWRLPTREELKNIFDSSLSKMTFTQKRQVGYPTAFEDGGGLWYWSAEEINADEGWAVSFYTGIEKLISKNKSYIFSSVRLVRSVASSENN